MQTEDKARSGFRVRPYRPEDRAHVRQICGDTGFLGSPIDPVFQDRELFNDFLTSPYTDAEPECCFVLENQAGVLEGYLTASRNSARHEEFIWKQLPGWLVRAVRGFVFSYNHASRKYLLWLLFRGWRETPNKPKEAAHFHVNLRPSVRSVEAVRTLIDAFLKCMGQYGVRCVYGQIVTRGDRRGERMFARYGFRVTDRKEVTKFRQHSKEKVFLCTVVKDLAEFPLLYGKDLQKEGGRRYRKSGRKLLLSLHDFHSGSRLQIIEQLEFCLSRCPGHASILVIPEYHHGRCIDQCAESVKVLSQWQEQGHDLALHGYYHDREGLPGNSWWWTRVYSNQESEFYNLSDDEAERRLEAGLAIWRRLGWTAAGFIAPGWLYPNSLEPILRRMGFAYTCRLRELVHLADGTRDPAWAGVYSLRSGWRKFLALRWQPIWKSIWADRDLVRLSLHPRDLEEPLVRRQVGVLLEELANRGYRSVSYSEHVQV
ncbi:MAG: DUF2334 domain-containing protein [Verrucomicrobia bacterium]|nr:DUF2334 domain-containing protein [Verrucomicrobiota bacterium]